MIPRLRRVLLGAAPLLALWAFPSFAEATLEIDPADVHIEVLRGDGQPEDRAGATPDRLRIDYKFTQVPGPFEALKDLLVSQPAGLIGRSGASALCPRESIGEFPVNYAPICPSESQIGTAHFANDFAFYEVEPGPDESSVFGTTGRPGEVGKVTASPGPGGEGLVIRNLDIATSPRAFTGLPSANEGEIEMWGIPADHQKGTSTLRRPLLTTSTNCSKVPTLMVSGRTWQHPERWITTTVNSGHPLIGCEQIPFDAAISMTLDQSHADAPTGSSFEITAPLSSDPDARANSAIRSMSLDLPRGMAISLPGSAGLVACGDEQIGFGDESAPTCPPASQVGSAVVHTDPAAKPMNGRIYLGREKPGERFRLFIAASAPGTQIKIAGALRPDPGSDRINVSFPRLPEVLMSKMTLSLDSGPGALLATPTTCGTASTDATLTPYSGTAPIQRSATVRINGCPASVPFAPRFSAGSSSTAAGAPTSFSVRISRRDGEGMPERIAVQMPPGLAGALGSVTACDEAAARAAACPPASRIGTAATELGPGPEVARLRGDLFLTGPYKGAPFGIETILPAKVGPYDLGSLALRGTMSLDRETGQVSIATDSLPQQIEGVPVRVRSLRFTIDRPGFLRNPTSCAPASVGADIRSTEGARAKVSSPFRVADCVGLPLKPSFALSLAGRSQLHKKGRPGLTIAGKMTGSGANMRAADIHLPRILKLDASRLEAICSRADAARGRCQKAATIGRASGISPILSQPLKGDVYAVQPKGDGSPDVWATLSGQGIEILLKGETVVRKGRVEARLTELPDFPLRSFALGLRGGEDGVFVLRRSPCSRRVSVPIEVEGQNEALRDLAPRLKVRGGCR